MINLCATIIVFNGDFVLRQVLEQLYPHCSQILISEGCVDFWAKKGFTTSTDRTNEIIHNFPDPENKIQIVHGVYKEKTEQANAIMSLVEESTDYIFAVDSDECYKTADIIKLKEFLEEVQPDSMAIRSCTFFGGFDHYLTGFEQLPNNFRRVFKYEKGAYWAEHRPPRLSCEMPFPLHIDGDQLFEATGIQMMHYSYVSPDMVYQKMQYYSESVNLKNMIPQYFRDVWLAWVTGDEERRAWIEEIHDGTHEFENRMECYPILFEGTHPEAIQRDMKELKAEFDRQLEKYL